MQDKLDCQHNFCGWSYLFKGTEEKDLWNLLSSLPRPSHKQPSHSSWVRHTKMDVIRTESTSSLSSCFLPYFSPSHVSLSLFLLLHLLWRFHCGVPDFWLPEGPMWCWPARSSQEVQRLDTHHQHWLLFYAHQTHSARHLNEIFGPGTSGNWENKYMTVTACS